VRRRVSSSPTMTPSCATELADINIAAGIAHNELLGVDD
jgi:hypothetical protein